MADIVADLRLLRERGLVRIRHTELTALRRAVSLSPSALAEGPDGSGPRAIEALLRAAVANLGGGQLAAAAEHTFGLNRGGRDRPAQDRRQRAAQEYSVSQERFRKYHERVVIEQVAEEILELCQPTARGERPGGRFLAQVRFHAFGGGHGPATRLVTIRAKSGRVPASKPRSRGPPASQRS